jgi:hypothetical protein
MPSQPEWERGCRCTRPENEYIIFLNSLSILDSKLTDVIYCERTTEEFLAFTAFDQRGIRGDYNGFLSKYKAAAISMRSQRIDHITGGVGGSTAQIKFAKLSTRLVIETLPMVTLFLWVSKPNLSGVWGNTGGIDPGVASSARAVDGEAQPSSFLIRVSFEAIINTPASLPVDPKSKEHLSGSKLPPTTLPYPLKPARMLYIFLGLERSPPCWRGARRTQWECWFIRWGVRECGCGGK